METKLRAIFESGLGLPVAALCAELGISRDSYYRYLRRWREEGPPGLLARSRRPRTNPRAVPPEVEDEVVRLRKELPLDNGAQAIVWHLARAGRPAPSVATVHRILVRRGMVVPQPHKRPRSAVRRFEWPRPNAAWQIDATRWALADGSEAWVMDLLDDHSRLALAVRACDGPTGEAAWDAFCVAAAAWGLPARVMSDNGSCFTARFQGGGAEAPFERDLRALGVRHLLSSPAHPQTCGKLERFHQTLKRWLRARPLAPDHAALQDQLDEFLAFYNHERPHRALAGGVPAERWGASGCEGPGPPIPAAPTAVLRRVSATGTVGWTRRHVVGVGAEHAGATVVVVARGDDLSVFGPAGLVRRLTLDRSRRYQPTGGAPGRRPRTT